MDTQSTYGEYRHDYELLKQQFQPKAAKFNSNAFPPDERHRRSRSRERRRRRGSSDSNESRSRQHSFRDEYHYISQEQKSKSPSLRTPSGQLKWSKKDTKTEFETRLWEPNEDRGSHYPKADEGRERLFL